MNSATVVLDRQFPEMRWRCLSLAADLDRVERAAGGKTLRETDPRLQTLARALSVLLEDGPNRAQKVQQLFSDTTPPPITLRTSR